MGIYRQLWFSLTTVALGDLAIHRIKSACVPNQHVSSRWKLAMRFGVGGEGLQHNVAGADFRFGLYGS
jgi:hypothetical protein